MGFVLGDDETSVATLRKTVQAFISERDWEKYHNPKNIAASICIEGAELLELFQWTTLEQSEELGKDKEKRQRIREELSDVVIYCLGMANSIDIDLSDAILEKLELAKRKYPTDLYRGKAHLSS
jgi:NTP pyrophosphatase (non-canonical NTP hydrolase)